MLELKTDHHPRHLLHAGRAPRVARLRGRRLSSWAAARMRTFLAGDWTTGAVTGRIAGRITNSRINIDGANIRSPRTSASTSSMAGRTISAIRHWNVQPTDNSLRFSLHSPDGDQGYPGALDVTATYAVNGNTLSLDFEARTTKPTVINLTNHAYWNMSGGERSAFDHEMQIIGVAAICRSTSCCCRPAKSGTSRAPAGTSASSARSAASMTIAGCWTARAATLKHGLTLQGSRLRPHHGGVDHRGRHADVHRRTLGRRLPRQDMAPCSNMAPSPSNRRTSPMRRPTRISRAQCCAPARSTASAWSGGSRSKAAAHPACRPPSRHPSDGEGRRHTGLHTRHCHGR